MKNKVTILVTLFTILMLIAACTSTVDTTEPPISEEPEVAEEERLRITYIVPAIAHPTFLTAKEAFEKAAEDYNFEPIWAGSTLPDANEMVKQIEIAIASQVDGLIIMAAVPDAMTPAIQEAHDAGIPVVTVIADAKDADKLAYLGLNNENYGKIATDVAIEALDGKKPMIAVMVPTFENQSGIEIIESLKASFASYGEYEWLTTVESKSDMVTAVSIWENVFTTYPEVNVIFSIGSEGGPAAAKVMEEMDITIEDVVNIGISDIAETLDGIRSGYIYASMSENIPRIGYQPAEWIVNFIRNGVRPDPINDTGTFPITIENVDTYREIENDKSLWK